MIEINWSPDEKSLRRFGAVALVGFSLLATAAWLWWQWAAAAVILAALGVLAAILSRVHTAAVRYVYLGVVLLTWPLGFAVAHLLMAIVYYGVVTPIGLALRIAGQDPMQRTFDETSGSYWQPHAAAPDASSYFRQF